MENEQMHEELKQMARELRNRDIQINVFEIFEQKWCLPIIFELFQEDSMRFGELRKRIGKVTNTMLTNGLRNLERQGVVKRVQFNEIPPHTEYSLTQSGQELLPIMYEMVKWGKKYAAIPEGSMAKEE